MTNDDKKTNQPREEIFFPSRNKQKRSLCLLLRCLWTSSDCALYASVVVLVVGGDDDDDGDDDEDCIGLVFCCRHAN